LRYGKRLVALISIIVSLLLGACEKDCDHALAPEYVDRESIAGGLTVYCQSDLDELDGIYRFHGELQLAGHDLDDPIRDLSPLRELVSIDKLTLIGTEILNLDELANVREIGHLSLSNNDSLTSLLGLSEIHSLRELTLFSNTHLTSLEALGQVDSLTTLNVRWQHNLTTLDVFLDLTYLETLSVQDCELLESLTASVPLPAIRNLELKYLPSLTSLDLNGESSSDLEELTLTSVGLQVFPEDLNLSSLTSLSIRNVSLPADLAWLGPTPSLRSCRLTNTGSTFASLAGAGDLGALEYLEISDCPGLVTLDGAPDLGSLQELNIAACSNLTALTGLAELPSLRELTLYDCPALIELGDAEFPNLETAMVGHLEQIQFHDLTALAMCESLSVRGGAELESLSGIGVFTNLTTLSVEYCYGLTSMTGLGSLSGLKNLTVSNCTILEDLNGAEPPPSMRSLVIKENQALRSLDGLESLRELYFLNIEFNLALEDLGGLHGLESLAYAYFTNWSLEIEEINDLLNGIEDLGYYEINGIGSED